MKLRDQFNRLYQLMHDQKQPGLPALADAMHCSERNMRHLLSKMQDQGWLRWTPARGRGHHSELEFRVTPDALALDQIQGLLAQGELEQAFASLGRQQKKQLAARLPEFLDLRDGNRDVLRLPMYRPVSTLDPMHAYGRLEAHLVRQIFSRLMTFDHQTRSLRPVIAHHWEHNEDGSVWHFWLRPRLHFHDGSDLGPEDVKASFLRLRDQTSMNQRLYRHLLRVETGPDRRVSFYLKHSDWLWPHLLATSMSSVVPRQRARNFAQFPVGSGAFQVIRNNPYQLTLRAFASYYREGALLDEIDLWVMQPCVAEPTFDMQYGYTPPGQANQQQQKVDESGCTYLIMNPDTPLLRQQSGRQQIAAILKPELLFPEPEPARAPAYGLLPEWQHKTSPEHHQRVAAGTRLRLISGQTKEMRQLAERIKALLEQAGFSVEWKTIPLKEQIARDWLQQCDLYLGREMLHDDKDFGCFEWFGNDSHFRHWLPDSMNQWLDKQLCDIQSMPDAADRMQAYAGIGRELVQGYWIIPLSHESHFVSVAPHIAGVRMTPLGFVSFCELWVKKDLSSTN